MQGGSTISGYGRHMPPPSASLVNHFALDDDRAINDMYQFGERLGAGNFGVVWHVTHVDTGERYACKMINKEKVALAVLIIIIIIGTTMFMVLSS